MSRNQQPSDAIVAEVAWHYFVKNRTQGEIAKLLGLSRPTIINYIRAAKERQIVCLKVSGSHFRANDLADKLMARYNLKSAHIVTEDGLEGVELTRAVCEVAAHFLPDFLEPGDCLGVSWGQTVSFVSEAVPYWPIENLTVRQIIGSMANPLLPTCESCSTEIARKFSATCINLNAPAVCTSQALAKQLSSEPIVQEQLQRLSDCNKAIFSLSPCTPDTHVVQFKLATPDDIEQYVANHAVGIIAGRFIDKDGAPVQGELDARLMGIDLETLRAMDNLLVVSGKDKTAASRAALKGGFANHFIGDALLAEAILDETD